MVMLKEERGTQENSLLENFASMYIIISMTHMSITDRDFSTWLVMTFMDKSREMTSVRQNPSRVQRSPTGSVSAMVYLVCGTRKPAPKTKLHPSLGGTFPSPSPHPFLAFACVESAPPNHTDCFNIRPYCGNFPIGGRFATEVALLVALVTCSFCRYVALKTPHNKLYIPT